VWIAPGTRVQMIFQQPAASLNPRFTAAEIVEEPFVIQRKPRAGEAVTRIYCLRCGSQVSPERREADPDGWWACARGCNTKYNSPAAFPQARPTT